MVVSGINIVRYGPNYGLTHYLWSDARRSFDFTNQRLAVERMEAIIKEERERHE